MWLENICKKKNLTIALNAFYAKKGKVYPAYILKHKSGKSYSFNDFKRRKWHYLAVKKLFALLREITSKHLGDFYCLKCLSSFATENKCESHKKVCENKDFCNVAIPSKDTKILEFNQYWKSDKVSFIIYAGLECSSEKIDGCKDNPENSSRTKVGENIFHQVFQCLQYLNKDAVYWAKD